MHHKEGVTATGQWQNDLKHGHGTERWVDGASYTGDYVAGLKQGQGVFNWADGSSYEGAFFENKI